MIFQMAAVLLLLVFYGCYFGKMIAQKEKGIQTDQIGKGKTGTVRVIELTMKVATFCVPIVEGVCILWNRSCLPTWARWAGAILAALGDGVFICSVVTMRDNWRAGVSKRKETELVTDGIYQISRNPAFLGFELVYAGVLLMFFDWGLFAVSAFAAVMFHLQIVKAEEPFLEKAFGEAYIAYRNKVNRYFGRRGKESRQRRDL